APIAKVGGVSAGFQVRSAKTGLYVMAEVLDATHDRDDRVTFTVGGKAYTVKRNGAHDRGFAAAALPIGGGYRVEALLPSGTATDLDVTVRDAKGGTDISWTGQLTFTPAVKVATAPHALPLPGATPVVDGKVDLAWALAPEIKTQTW